MNVKYNICILICLFNLKREFRKEKLRKRNYRNKEDRLTELCEKYNRNEYTSRQFVSVASYLVVPAFN